LVSLDKGMEIAKPFNQGSCRFLSNQLNIHWDGSIPICCVTFDRRTSTIADDYLTTPMSEILERKKSHPMCAKCTQYDIPGYLLGVNQKAWKEEADRVIAEDRRSEAEPKAAAKGRSRGLKLIQ
jgi:hypothetical protein